MILLRYFQLEGLIKRQYHRRTLFTQLILNFGHLSFFIKVLFLYLSNPILHQDKDSNTKRVIKYEDPHSYSWIHELSILNKVFRYWSNVSFLGDSTGENQKSLNNKTHHFSGMDLSLSLRFMGFKRDGMLRPISRKAHKVTDLVVIVEKKLCHAVEPEAVAGRRHHGEDEDFLRSDERREADEEDGHDDPRMMLHGGGCCGECP